MGKDRRYNIIGLLVFSVIFGGIVLGITAIQVLVGKHIGHPNDPKKWSHGESR